MNYYDYDDYDIYNRTPSEFDEKIEELKSYLRDSVKKELLSDLEQYKNLADKYKKESIELREKVKIFEQQNSLLIKTNDFFEIINTKINKDNVTQLISFLFTPTFNEKTQDCTVHWGLYVNYYNDRKSVLNILKYAGVDVPYDSTVILPHEWDKQLLDKFFDTMSNHVNCNNCTYGDNLRFWTYFKAKEPFGGGHSYDEIPWQFVLRNPLLNSREYAIKIATEMSKHYGNGQNFCMLDLFQKLDAEILSILVTNTLPNPQKYNSEVNDFLIRNIELVKDENSLEILVKVLLKKWREYGAASKMPSKFQKKIR